MILPFSTQINGKETLFVEKILKCLLTEYEKTDRADLIGTINCVYDYERFLNNEKINVWQNLGNSKPKLHTLRDDINDRWHKGIIIDFFINVRQKNMFRFAPKVPVISTQQVLMTYTFNDLIQISVDDKELFSYIDRLEFAQNDGFDTWEDFFNYFYPKIKAAPKELYKPKLIHWTDFKY
jgi:hypothetical protein